MSQNLTSGQLLRHKATWLKEVAKVDHDRALGLLRTDRAQWDYINVRRVIELLASAGVSTSSGQHFKTLVKTGEVKKDGLPTLCRRQAGRYRLEGIETIRLYLYLKSLLELATENHLVLLLDPDATRSEIEASARPGAILAVQGAFDFKRLDTTISGPGQMRRGRRTWGGVSFEFVFDAYERTSASAAEHTMGHRVATALLIVRSTESRGKALSIQCTCLAIGVGFDRVVRKVRPSFAAMLAKKQGEEDWDEDEFSDRD
ncbi:MAG: hypothetical protein WEB04_09150 [Dehalococcoidia bacterium]